MEPEDAKEKPAPPAPGGSPEAPPPDRKAKRVLVIDDSPIQCRIVEVALTKKGYEVQSAFHGSEGVRLALEGRPDCIILDASMPELDGLEVCRMLRSHAELDGTPIIMYATRNTKDDVILSLRAGSDDYIVKPAPAAVLCEKVGRAICRPRRPRPTLEEPGEARVGAPAKGVGAVEAEARSKTSHDRRKGSLLDPPALFHDLLAIPEASASSREDLAALVARDPEISSAILRMPTSPRRGKARPHQSLSSAIDRLGVQAARGRIIALCLRQLTAALPEGCGLDRSAYWHHALACAVAARILARGAGASEEAAFLAGILHDVGKIVLAARDSVPYGRAVELARREDIPLEEAERRLFGSDHPSIGGRLAAEWKLPRSVAEAIEGHHRRDGAGAKPRSLDTVVLSAANLVANALRIGGAGDTRIEEIPARDAVLFGGALRNRRVLRQTIVEELVEVEEASGGTPPAYGPEGGKETALRPSVDLWSSDPVRFLVCETFLASSGIRVRRLEELSGLRERRPLVCRLACPRRADALECLEQKAAEDGRRVVLILPPAASAPDGFPPAAAVVREPYDGAELIRALGVGVSDPCDPPVPSL